MMHLALLLLACLGATYSLEVTTARSQNVPLPMLRVVTVIIPPFMMENEEGSGNDQYKGFLKDLLTELASRANFDFTIRKMNHFGRQTGQDWTGAIGEIVYNNSDLAVAPLTITEARRHADNLQFAEPFMKYNSTLLVSSKATNIAALNQLPCANASNPRLGDYARVGAISESSTYNNLRGVKTGPLGACWSEIDSHSVASQRLGLSKARNGSFAFVMEKPSADYIAGQAPCDLKTQLNFKIRGIERSYHFAMRDDPHFRNMARIINQTLSNLKAEGVISELYDRWWLDECSLASHNVSISIFTTLIFILISKLL